MIGSLLANLGGPWRLYVELAVAGALLVAVGAQSARLSASKASTAEARQQLSDERAEAARAALKATAEARAEESRRAAAQRDIADETQRMVARARADGVVADAAAGRLSDRAATVARGCAAAGNPAAAAGSAPAADPGALLADVLRRIDEAAGHLASVADESRAAGEACVRSYESLTK